MMTFFDNGCCSFLTSCCEYDYTDGDRRTSVVEAKEKLKDVLKVPILKELTPNPVFLPLTFVPDIIIKEIVNESFHTLPYYVYSDAVLLMVDVCGFTSLTESYCQKGVSGVEELASILNGFMSTLAAMLLSADGDILSFGGDAFLVYWHIKGEKTEKNHIVEKAYNCAVSLQSHECLKTKNLDGTLKVKIGMVKGEIVTWILGLPKDFMMFAVAGHALPELHKAEEMCLPGDIIISHDVYQCLKEIEADMFTTSHLPEGFVKISDYKIIFEENEPNPSRDAIFEQCSESDILMAKKFTIPGVRDVKNTAELNYLSELTMVNIVFVALLNADIEAPKVLDKTFDILLDCAIKQGGILNKVLLFDKGCTYLVIFGIPGLKHSNDAARSLLCSNDIVNKITALNKSVSIGVASGTCYCGLVGHPQRQEYTVIGSRVNMAARLMVAYSDEPISIDTDTYHLSREELGDANFVELPTRKLKGIDSTGAIYAYRIQHKRKAPRMSLWTIPTETNSLLGKSKEIEMINNCVRTMYKNQQTHVHEETLLPVILIEGQSEYAKSYFMYAAVKAASELDYKIFSVCTIAGCKKDDFLTASMIFLRIIGIHPKDGIREREQKILNSLPESHQKNLYLLNHLFHVEFPILKMVETLKMCRHLETLKLFQAIFKKTCAGYHIMIAIDDVDFMDEQSFSLLHTLAEEEGVLIVMTLSKDFKEPSVSASLLYLKAHTHINLSATSEDYCAPLICWFLSVKGVHKHIVHCLKRETKGDFELLQEVCLSASVTEYTVLVPLKEYSEKDLENYYISNFTVDDGNENQVLVLDIKPGVQDLRAMVISSTISDAVSDALNYLSVQDRLILKRAAVLGVNFTQHALEATSPKFTNEQVERSINNLMQKNIISSSCTSYFMLDKIPPESPFKHVSCYNVCFCSKAVNKSILRNYKVAYRRVGPYHCLRFRSKLFRQWIMDFMTTEQYENMHLETANGLEINGIFCMFCKSKKTTKTKMESDLQEMSCAPSQVSTKLCFCLQIKPRLYRQIALIYSSINVKLLPAYYQKKAAQALNDINCPVQALNYAEEAEAMLPDSQSFIIQDNTYKEEFNMGSLVSSIKRTQARSCLLLRNTYSAAALVHQALLKLGMELIHFYGVFQPQEFKNLLQRFSLLYAEEITKIISVLSQTLLNAREYYIAWKVLRIEYVALSHFPTDFIQVLTFMISSFTCRTAMKPRKVFYALENNTLRICRHRLQNYEILLNLKEIQVIGKAYIVLIEANLNKNHLERGEIIANEALKILNYVQDQNCVPLIYLLLIEIENFLKKFKECWEYVNKLYSIIDISDNFAIYAQYFCAASSIIIQENLEGSLDQRNKALWKTNIGMCKEFASKWNMSMVLTMASDLAFYVSAKLSEWCLKADVFVAWPERENILKHCYNITVELFDSQHNDSYWSIGGSLTYFRTRITLGIREDFAESKEYVLDKMKKIERKIKLHFPVYKKAYKQILKEIKTLELSYNI